MMTRITEHEEIYYEYDDVPAPPEAYEYEDERVANLPPRKLYQLVWLIAIIVEMLIGFRVFLRLIAANPQSGFASFIYGITTPILAPFAGLTTTPSANGVVFEVSSVIAMIVYALLFWLGTYVIRVLWDR